MRICFVGLLAVACSTVSCGTDAAPVAAAILGDVWTDRTIAVGEGDSLHVVHRGLSHARTIVFVPGLSDTWESYQSLAAALSDSFGMVLVDALGHGESTRRPGTSAPPRQSAALAAALDSLGVRPFAMIGHSYGGVVVQHYGAAHPELPAAVLMATMPTLQGHPADADFASLVATIPDSVPEEVLAGQAASFFEEPPDSVVGPYIEASRATPGYVWREIVTALRTTDTRPMLTTWRPRTLLVMAENDKVVGSFGMDALRAALPNADVARIERTSHAMHWERPDTVAAVIAEFLNRSSEATARTVP